MRKTREAIIVTNNSCNLRCIYCKVEDLSREILPKEEIKGLIDELKRRGISTLHYIGGEPLLRKDIQELLSYSKSVGIKNVLHSNGSVLKLLIKVLPYIDVYHTCLNGDKLSHEATRGEGTFENVMLCINAAREHQVEVVVDMIITAKNCANEDIDFVAKTAKENGFKVNFQKVFVHSLVEVNPGDIITIKAPNKKVFALFEYIEKVYDESIFLNTKEFIKIHQSANQIEVDECNNDIIVIGHDGHVFSCYGCMEQKNSGLELGWGPAIDIAQSRKTGCVTCPYSNHAESNLKNKE